MDKLKRDAEKVIPIGDSQEQKDNEDTLRDASTSVLTQDEPELQADADVYSNTLDNAQTKE